MKNKIRYISLEPAAFLSDIFFLSMNAEERGVYVSIILHLYENGGFLPLDKTLISNFCNCRNFEKVFEKIRKKFLIKNKKISHKRVLLELKRARQISQLQRKKGVIANKIRWNSYPRGDATGIPSGMPQQSPSEAKIGEDKVSEAKIAGSPSQFKSFSQKDALPKNLNSRFISLYEKLCLNFKQRTHCDNLSLYNLCLWIQGKVESGKLRNDITNHILRITSSSKKGKSRKPIAVFFAQLKTDLGYKQDE